MRLLIERIWKKSIEGPAVDRFHKALGTDNPDEAMNAVNALSDVLKEILKVDPEFEDTYNDILDDIASLGTPDSFEDTEDQTAYEQWVENFNYILSMMYDYCDANSIWFDPDKLEENLEDAEDISYLIFDTSYGQKYIEELDIASKEEIDHYFTLIRNVHEAEVFNYHSDYWGYDEDYQEQNIELIDALSPYINKRVAIQYDDGVIEGTLLGIAIDKQYNSISHTKVILDDITELD